MSWVSGPDTCLFSGGGLGAPCVGVLVGPALPGDRPAMGGPRTFAPERNGHMSVLVLRAVTKHRIASVGLLPSCHDDMKDEKIWDI